MQITGWIGLGDGFGPLQLGVGDLAKISFFYFIENTTIHDFIMILT